MDSGGDMAIVEADARLLALTAVAAATASIVDTEADEMELRGVKMVSPRRCAAAGGACFVSSIDIGGGSVADVAAANFAWGVATAAAAAAAAAADAVAAVTIPVTARHFVAGRAQKVGVNHR
jgi:hypothetical protein